MDLFPFFTDYLLSSRPFCARTFFSYPNGESYDYRKSLFSVCILKLILIQQQVVVAKALHESYHTLHVPLSDTRLNTSLPR